MNSSDRMEEMNDMRARRIQMGCSITERDLETSQVRKLGNRTEAYSWNYIEQAMAKKKTMTLNTSANGP